MHQWIKDLYLCALKENREVKDLAVFPNEDGEAFVIEFGDWWENSMVDKRYIPVQDYIDAKVDQTIVCLDVE